MRKVYTMMDVFAMMRPLRLLSELCGYITVRAFNPLGQSGLEEQ